MPIKKEKTQSALNNFDEFTMVSPSILAQYIGFTEAEVQKLSDKYHQDFDKVKKWYDGYLLKDYQVYNPRAVVSVMLKGEYKSYWSETASYEAIVPFINMNYDGLKTAIIEMPVSYTHLIKNGNLFESRKGFFFWTGHVYSPKSVVDAMLKELIYTQERIL